MSEVRTAIVTGGAGFIGSHAVDQCLAAGWRVRVVDNLTGGRLVNLSHLGNEPRVVVEQRDIRSFQPGDTIFKGVDYVLHFAGIGDLVPSIEQPLEYFSVHALGTAHILDCARSDSTI